MAEITEAEFHVLHHGVGAPRHRAECAAPWRDYFCAGDDGDDRATCEGLVAKGLMRRGRGIGRSVYFHVTTEGLREVAERLPELRRWYVETTSGVHSVYAETRSGARAEVVRSIAEVWNVPWREALTAILSVRLAPKATAQRRAA